jgi:hypothetical protein
MSIADEATGAHLQVKVYNCSQVTKLKEQIAIQDINECFKTWGMPLQIKIDNGKPFVNPRNLDIPTKSILWWIGIGIEVIQNPPRQPQQNGIVENLQGTLARWSNPSSHDTLESLELRLNEESEFQRSAYKIPAKKYKTRVELYPQLQTNQEKRMFDPDSFNIRLVYKFLEERVWKRKIRRRGDVRFWGKSIHIGKRFAHQPVYITFDPIEIQWILRDENGQLLKTSSKAIPNQETIKAFALKL